MQKLGQAAMRCAALLTVAAATLPVQAGQVDNVFVSVSPYGGRVYGDYTVSTSDGLRNASADTTRFVANGQLQGIFEGQLTSGAPVEAGGGTSFTVYGLDQPTALSFVLRLSGQHEGVIDDSAFGLYASASLGGGTAMQAIASFAGLGYVDNAPWAGDFAGNTTGSFSCFVAAANGGSASCPQASWDGQGSRSFTLTSGYATGWGGTLGAILQVSGAGAGTYGNYVLELVSVQAAELPPSGAYLMFDSGVRIDLAPLSPVPGPGSLALMGAGLALLLPWARRASQKV